MAELIPCIDCGHRVSSSAFNCPKCKSPKPHGVDCLVCMDDGGARVSMKEVHKHPHRSHSLSGPYYYHSECVRRILTIPTEILCRECNTTLFQSWNWEELCESGHESCKNCGMPDVFRFKGSCLKCYLPILIFHRMETEYSDKYHESCFQTVRRLAPANQRASIDSKERSNRIITSAGCIGALTGLILGIGISSVITLSMFPVRDVPGAAIIAAGIIGIFVGGFLGACIGEFIILLNGHITSR